MTAIEVEQKTDFYFLEFQGCLTHGHITHYAEDMKNPFNMKTLKNLHQEKEKRKNNLLRNLKIDHYIEMWECEFDELKQSPEFHSFAAHHNLCSHSAIKPRKALQGGRCNAFRLHYKVGPGEKIRYYDIVSLYPYCCICKGYFIGIPTIIKHSFPNNCLTNWEGLVQCE